MNNNVKKKNAKFIKSLSKLLDGKVIDYGLSENTELGKYCYLETYKRKHVKEIESILLNHKIISFISTYSYTKKKRKERAKKIYRIVFKVSRYPKF